MSTGQMCHSAAVGLQRLEKERKQQLPKSKALQSLTEVYKMNLDSYCSCPLSECHHRPLPDVVVPPCLSCSYNCTPCCGLEISSYERS